MGGRGRKRKATLKRQSKSIESVSTVSNTSEFDFFGMWIEDFEMQVKSRLAEFDALLAKKLQALEWAFSIALKKIPREVGKTIINNWETLDKARPSKSSILIIEDENDDKKGKRKRRHSSTDDSIFPKEKLHSADCSSSSRNKMKMVTKSKFATPSSKLSSFPRCITPKVHNLNAPLSMVRHPRLGEMAVSLSGSPLMVTPMIQNNTSNVNIPLSDGRVLSILPEKGLRPYDIPSLDEETRRELQTLRENIDAFISMSNRT